MAVTVAVSTDRGRPHLPGTVRTTVNAALTGEDREAPMPTYFEPEDVEAFDAATDAQPWQAARV